MMSKLSELGHWVWMEAQLGAPPFVGRAVVPRLHEGKEIGRLLVKPSMTLYQWQGQNEGGSLTVTYTGLGYAEPMLKSLLFTQAPAEKEIGRVPVWQPEELVNAPAGDITIVESSKHLIRKLPQQNAFVLPFRVQFVVDIRGEWEEVEGHFRPNVRRHIRKARGYDCYQYEISHREQDLKMFYHTMYLPTVQERHGDLAAILPEREADQLLRYGWLFLLKRDGVIVCGSLGYAHQGVVEFKEMGVLNGDLQLFKQGVVEAMNYLRIRWAHQEGYAAISFGDSWPYLSGIFQAKRKWGSVVSIHPYEHKQIWIRIQRVTPAVAEFLEHNPCVIINEKERLQGLIVIDDLKKVAPETEATWHKLYATPGLSGLVVRSIADWVEKPKFLSDL
jgi:hypothetical protein